MLIHHRGLEIALADDDPRVAIIETVLFSKPLPPPLPTPETPKAAVPSLETVPVSIRRAWRELSALQRRELAILAERPHRAEELERILGRRFGSLGGFHRQIHTIAERHRAKLAVSVKGRGREGRSFFLRPETCAHVRTLVAHTNEGLESLPAEDGT